MMSVAQPLSALIFAFLGFCFGVFFDLYRALRRLGTPGQLLTASTDLLFWFTYTVWVYIVLLRVNSGEVRVFLLLSLAIGAVSYFAWFSNSLMRAWHFLFRRAIALFSWLNLAVNKLIDTVLRVLLWPYRLLCTFLFLPLYTLARWLLLPFVRLLTHLRSWLAAIAQRMLARPRVIGQAVAKSIAKLWRFPPEDE